MSNEHKTTLRDAIRKAIDAQDAARCNTIAELCSQHGMRYDDIAKCVSDAGRDPLEWEALLAEHSEADDE